MFKAKKAHSGILALCLSGALALGLAAAPSDAIKVDGHVLIGERVTHLIVDIQQNGAPLAGLRVKVADRPANEQGAGRYVLLTQDPLGVPGRQLQVTIEPPLVSAKPFMTIKALANAQPWIRITKPADEAHVSVNESVVPIAWSGGFAPYRLTARHEDQPNVYAFDESGIDSTRKAIPMSHFAKGKRYLINVDFEAGNFVFTGEVARGSRLVLIERSSPVHLNID